MPKETLLPGTLSEIEKAFAGLPDALQQAPAVVALRQEAEQIFSGHPSETPITSPINLNLNPKDGNLVARLFGKINAAIGAIPLDAIKKNPEILKQITNFRSRVEDALGSLVPESFAGAVFKEV